MKKKSAILICGILIILGTFFFAIPTKLKTEDTGHYPYNFISSIKTEEPKSAKKGYLTNSTIADADSYVESGSSSSNFGSLDWVYIGSDAIYGNDEAYFRFPLSDKPTQYVNACISLNFGGVDKTYNFPVYLIESAWEESTITWSNKPIYGVLITTLTVSSSGIYKINVTDYIGGGTNISICLSYDNSVMDYIYADSREDASAAPIELPQLIWTYEVEFGFNITSPKSTDKLNYGDHKIVWDSTGAGPIVIIELYNNSLYVENITDATINDGEYIWNIPYSANYSGNKYQIKMIDSSDNHIYNYSNYFEILLYKLPPLVSSNDGDDGDDGEGDESIPFGQSYLLFALLTAISVIILTKRKLFGKRR